MIFVSSTVTKSLKIGPTILHEFADFAANLISKLWRFTSHFWGTNTYRVRLQIQNETNTKRNKYETKQNTKQIKKLQMWFSQESILLSTLKSQTLVALFTHICFYWPSIFLCVWNGKNTCANIMQWRAELPRKVYSWYLEGERNDFHIWCRLLWLVNTRIVHHFGHSGITELVFWVFGNYNLTLKRLYSYYGNLYVISWQRLRLVQQ